MRIWVLNHYASPPDRPAGTRHYDFGRVLRRQGHEVTIFASSFSHHSLREERLRRGEWMRPELVKGVRFVWLRTWPYRRNDHHRALNMLSYTMGVLAVQHRFRRPDVVVGSSVHLGAAAAAWAIGAIRRVPFAFEVRDLWPQALIDMGALRDRSTAARVLRSLERFLYRRAHLVISLLPGATEYLAQAGVPPGKIVYVPNGIADPGPAPAQLSFAGAAVLDRIEQQRRSGRMVAGYTGAHGLANGLGVLVHAARTLRERAVGGIALVFVGDGPAKAECQRLAAEYGLANVIFCPPVPKQDVPAVLRSLDVALFPLLDSSVARYGLSSNKLFDYLGNGLPVLCCCGVSGSPVQASGGGICVAAEPEAVADALMQLATMGQAARQAMGERGRHWVHEHHLVSGLASRFAQALSGIQR